MSITVAVPKKNFSDLSAKAFKTKVKGRIFRGLVVRKGEKYFAYQNLCQHLPITLDLDDERFLNHERTFLQCHMHGALYEYETGLCVAGPCVGTKLVALELVEEETRLVVKVPDKFEE